MPKREALKTELTKHIYDEGEDMIACDVVDSIEDLIYNSLPVEEADALWNKLNDIAESIH